MKKKPLYMRTFADHAFIPRRKNQPRKGDEILASSCLTSSSWTSLPHSELLAEDQNDQ